MERALVVCHLGRHLRLFGRADIKVLQSMGYEVHFASNFNLDIDKAEDDSVILHQIDFNRSPLSLKNLTALIQMIKLLKKEKYSLMHCQSPTGGVVSRIAAKIVGFKPVIYMAHGLPFYNDVHNMQNFIIRRIESLCARWTDCLITINEEDYQNGRKLKLRSGGRIFKTHGVGIKLERLTVVSESSKKELRKRLSIPLNDFVVVCIGRLDKNKNQELLIRAISRLKKNISHILLLLVGTDEKNGELQRLAKEIGVYKQVRFMGYRNDVPDILASADVLASASFHEGLPVNVMEAMTTGLPVIVTNCRGNNDLVEDGINGFIVTVDNQEEMADAMLRIYNSPELARKMGEAGLEKIKQFSIDTVKSEMLAIYRIVTKNQLLKKNKRRLEARR